MNRTTRITLTSRQRLGLNKFSLNAHNLLEIIDNPRFSDAVPKGTICEMIKSYEIKRQVNPVKTKSRDIELQCVAGCDVDKDNVVIAVVKRGCRTMETEIFSQDKRGVREAVKWLKDNAVERVVLESTGSYHNYFYDTFVSEGLNAIIINPLLIKSLIKSVGKNDRKDAQTMAELLLNFELKASNMPDDRMKQIRFMFRRIDSLKVHRTSITNRLNSMLRQNSIQLFRDIKINTPSGLGLLHGLAEGLSPMKNLENNWLGSRAKIPELLQLFPNIEELKPYVREGILEDLEEVVRLNAKIEMLPEKAYAIIDELGLLELIKLMCSVPTINDVLALRILGEMGIDLTFRYTQKEKFVKAIGLVPSNKVSGGKLIKAEATHGNIAVKMAVLNHVKPMCARRGVVNDFKNFYIHYKEKQGKNFMKATSAVGRKIMESLYAVIRDEIPYRTRAELKALNPKRFENVTVEIEQANGEQ